MLGFAGEPLYLFFQASLSLLSHEVALEAAGGYRAKADGKHQGHGAGDEDWRRAGKTSARIGGGRRRSVWRSRCGAETRSERIGGKGVLGS